MSGDSSSQEPSAKNARVEDTFGDASSQAKFIKEEVLNTYILQTTCELITKPSNHQCPEIKCKYFLSVRN